MIVNQRNAASPKSSGGICSPGYEKTGHFFLDCFDIRVSNAGMFVCISNFQKYFVTFAINVFIGF